MSEVISREGLLRLVDEWLEAGRRVVGPVADAPTRPGRARFAVLERSADLLLDGFIHPVNTAKECVLPKTEKLYDYEREGRRVRLIEPAMSQRPCHRLSAVRRRRLPDRGRGHGAITGTGSTGRRAPHRGHLGCCTAWDDQCFCTSVGLWSDRDRGSTSSCWRRRTRSYEVRAVTDEGRHLFDGAAADSNETGDDTDKGTAADTVTAEPTGPEPVVDLEHVRRVLHGDFSDPLWQEVGLRCLGCGSCTYTCPTCHCFDIVDESHGSAGCRIRNWDSCQFTQFTAHASGHNPRGDQAARPRQRIRHKFVVYPEKFGDFLCTGCGNCFRNCPVNLGVLDVLRTADARSEVVGVAGVVEEVAGEAK
jgi:ferredoxin